ncbi:hypothetical protein CQA37_05950 [Helicobacter sp. MIT 99-10781]|uniref:hypothetical protein n=1 Tax=Helicobacter sp. MIT 99-10781 TaxID=1332285 RepID=UPI000E1FBD9D|nr:hypothetical protein [Helicobacter sp. MIT 99-10781]RDU54155.1 hypothetical protein CQA37_05950 [Helicobacter sp. MIT 99-10781]
MTTSGDYMADRIIAVEEELGMFSNIRDNKESLKWVEINLKATLMLSLYFGAITIAYFVVAGKLLPNLSALLALLVYCVIGLCLYHFIAKLCLCVLALKCYDKKISVIMLNLKELSGKLYLTMSVLIFAIIFTAILNIDTKILYVLFFLIVIFCSLLKVCSKIREWIEELETITSSVAGMASRMKKIPEAEDEQMTCEELYTSLSDKFATTILLRC